MTAAPRTFGSYPPAARPVRPAAGDMDVDLPEVSRAPGPALSRRAGPTYLGHRHLCTPAYSDRRLPTNHFQDQDKNSFQRYRLGGSCPTPLDDTLSPPSAGDKLSISWTKRRDITSKEKFSTARRRPASPISRARSRLSSTCAIARASS